MDKAKVSYHVQQSLGGLRLVAAVALSSVIEDYEAAFRDAGYSAGVILPSMLAAIGCGGWRSAHACPQSRRAHDQSRDSRQEQLLLFRTLENTRGVTVTGEQLAEEVYPSVVFFQDTYHTNIERIYVAGLPESGGRHLRCAQTGADVRELVSSATIGRRHRGSVPALENGRSGGSIDLLKIFQFGYNRSQ